ncbi:type III-B CRISPR module-associated Cmr3 family protein [Thermodesulfatator autotrophicus]|uniref:Type III-B CRISPR module-associated protein Cmr3 n=1 Tax=Thermodesulfatator autotrophicus TaxID=1795632 RepID=A0A177E4N0_9BACT|nr:type III-B CRISPR module-associated Cmr3 family protein [Thermodesulfatator autotrophicus]OAG26923.1 hypothetical protein TH606_09665 [Thermodesulfatator autotrophicus]
MIAQWLEIKPFDTLFFRGGEPMEAGETHEAGVPIFPPVPETIIGALRTAILAQKGIDPERLKPLPEDQDLDPENLPLWGTPKRPGFSITGPLLKANGVVLFPAPASWFYNGALGETLTVYEARPLEPQEALPVKLSRSKALWVTKPPEEMEPLLGRFWLTRRALENTESFKLKVACSLEEISEDESLAVPFNLLLKTEERVGIARDNRFRVVKTGHLYAARHLRLASGVALLVGLDKPLCSSHLKEEGVFQLGGEGRLVRYRLIKENPQLPTTNNGRWLAISPLSFSKAQSASILDVPYASGKLIRVAGFDLRTGFHKPARSYFPVGAVFFTDKDKGLCELIPF